jgi:hypothetical protein
LAACARHLSQRHQLNRGYVAEIERRTGLPTVCLPYLLEGIEGPEEISALAAALIQAPEVVAA